MNWFNVIFGSLFNAGLFLLGMWLGPKMFGCSHKWTRWEATDKGAVYDSDNQGGMPIGKFEYQRRECGSCGKSQMREVRI
jgi:hypothetical protein